MITVKQAAELKAEAERLCLARPSKWDTMSLEQMAAAANGIGPECFPDVLRKAINARHPYLQVVAFVHDIEWDGNDGTRASFEESNDHFLANGLKVAKDAYSPWAMGRYMIIWDAWKLYRLLSKLGWTYYQMASDPAADKKDI